MDGGSTDAEALDAYIQYLEPAPRTRRKTARALTPKLDLRKLGGVESFVLSWAAEKISQVLGVKVQTAREWRRLGRIPPMWHRAARVLAQGDLGEIHPDWRGWQIGDSGQLRSPDAGEQGANESPEYCFQPRDVNALPFTRRRLAEMEARAQRGSYYTPPPPPPLTRQLDWISGGCVENNYKTEEDRERAHFETLLKQVDDERAKAEEKYRGILQKLLDWRRR